MKTVIDKDAKKAYCERLSKNIPVIRAKLGVSQTELAQRVGIARSSLALYEVGKKELPWSAFVAMLMLFLSNEETKAVFNSLEIYDEKLDNYLMFK